MLSHCPAGVNLKLNVVPDDHSLIKCVESIKAGWEPAPGSRRVLQFGSRYNYVTRCVHFNTVEPIPKTLLVDGLPTSEKWDNVIVNEYEPGQGISAHIDQPHWFGETVCSLSLVSSTTMTFTNVTDSSQRFILALPRGSLLTLSGEARYKWTHQIDSVETRRLSITYRTVNLDLWQTTVASFIQRTMPGVFHDNESALEFGKAINPIL